MDKSYFSLLLRLKEEDLREEILLKRQGLQALIRFPWAFGAGEGALI
jgi:hypothetical protein